MPEPTDIPAPLYDRTLVHGRNVMAAAGVILVLAYVPDIQIKSFSPLGFDFSKGGELSVWGLLAAVLVYYAIRFGYECWTDYAAWIGVHRPKLYAHTKTDRIRNKMYRHARRLNRKFWVLDLAPPALMFLAALVATYQQVAPLVKPPPSPPLL